uniref:Abnormal embryogenesis protein 30 (inferred by orthology to a C. elegans protein) n=1 Tax=Strongyloides venezuelensis TaxID=75913 RepID=A0A0K0F7R0_STRVS
MDQEIVDTESSGVVCRSTPFIEDSKSYKSSFPVYMAKWNPVHDSLVIASKKGDLCLRRGGYKKSWKVNVERIRGIYYEELGSLQKEFDIGTTLECIEWSPNGLYLAVAMTNGYLHILDYETGQVRYSQKFNFTITRMKWQWYIEFDAVKKFSQTFYDSSQINIRFPNFYEEEESNRERFSGVMATKEFCTENVPKDLFGTILFIVTDKDLLIHALSCGIFPVARFEAPFEQFGNFDSTSAVVNDINFDMSSRMLFVSYSGMAMAYPSYPPEIGVPEPESSEQSMGTNTHVVEFKIDFGSINSTVNIFLLACRWAHLYFSAIYIRSVFDYAISDWREQISTISNMFKASADDNNQVKNLSKELAKLIMFGASSPKAMYHFRFKIRPEGVRSIYDIIYTKFTALAKLINGPLKIGLLMVNDAHTRLSEETKSLGHNFLCERTNQLFKCHEDSVNIQALLRIVDDFQRDFEGERGSMLQLVRFMYSCQPVTSNFVVNKKKKVENTRILSTNYPLDYNSMVDYLVTDRIQPQHPESAFKKLLIDCGLPQYLDGDGIDEFIDTCFLQNYKQAKMNEYITLEKKNGIGKYEDKLKFVDEMYCEIHGIDKELYKEALKRNVTIPGGIKTIFNILDKKTEAYLKNGIVEGKYCRFYNIEIAHPIEHDKFLIFPNERMTKEFDIDGNVTRCSIDVQSTYVLHYLVFRKALGTASWNSLDSDGTVKVIRQIGTSDTISNDKSLEKNNQLTVITTGLEVRAKKSVVDCGINENRNIVGLIKLNESSNPDLNYPFIVDPNFGEVYIENNLDDYFVADQILIHKHFNIAGTISRDSNKIMCFNISSQKIEKVYKHFNF